MSLEFCYRELVKSGATKEFDSYGLSFYSSWLHCYNLATLVEEPGFDPCRWLRMGSSSCHIKVALELQPHWLLHLHQIFVNLWISLLNHGLSSLATSPIFMLPKKVVGLINGYPKGEPIYLQNTKT